MKQQRIENGDLQDFWPNKPLQQTGAAFRFLGVCRSLGGPGC